MPILPIVGIPTIRGPARIRQPITKPDRAAASRGNPGRTDAAMARQIEIGGKDLYRQARAIWRLAQSGDIRAQSGVAQLDAGTKTIHAAYKDLRRRDRFSADFRPTPYDVWSFRHDRAFGIPHPGAIPPGLVAHTLHYFTPPGGLVVDPMAGGGTTLDVCESMGRRCLAYDLSPRRADIRVHDIRTGFPVECAGADLIFCDPPYHTMLAQHYVAESIATAPLSEWVAFLHQLARDAFEALRPGGYFALLPGRPDRKRPARRLRLSRSRLLWIHGRPCAPAFFRNGASVVRWTVPTFPNMFAARELKAACWGQVRDLLVVRKPLQTREPSDHAILFMQDPPSCVSANGGSVVHAKLAGNETGANLTAE